MRASIFRSSQSQNKVNSSMNVKPGKIKMRKIKVKSIIHGHLSVHEKHGSKLQKFGGISAMFSPIAVLRNAGMLAKVGVRTLTRSGKAVPLLLT